jgi:hypothetical protein
MTVASLLSLPLGEENPRHDRAHARREAACAIQLVARSLAVDPAALSAAAYRGFCAHREELHLPSSLAISVLFVGWQRACERVPALTYDEADVEADVVRLLYGDPSRRHRDHATASHIRFTEPTGTAALEGPLSGS